MNLSYRQLIPFGVEFKNLKIVDVDRSVAGALRSALAEHGVTVFRNQDITDKDFVNFLKQLGPLTFTQGEKPVEGQPFLNLVTNVGRAKKPRSVFHADTSYISQPPAYTALRMVVRPQAGGETLFSNQYRAYETLPTWAKNRLSQSSVLHVVTGLTLSDRHEQQSWHPLFQKHPLSGRVAMYLSTPERCCDLSGPDRDRAEKIVRLLYKHSIRPSRLYKHEWQQGDVVVWDNRCTMHRADHSAVIGDRVLHRGLVARVDPAQPPV